MSESYFQKALSDFTIDFACKGAVYSMAKKGYAVSEIKEKLDFPIPAKTVAGLVWEYLLDSGTVLLTEPVYGEEREIVHYKKVQDQYGKVSFIQIKETVPVNESNSKKESVSGKAAGSGNTSGSEKINVSNSDTEYVPCEFGKLLYQNKDEVMKKIHDLNLRDREYLLELPWPLQTVWHKKDERIDRILRALD